MVGLISNNDETHYREEVAQLAEWCGANNLSLNVEKTKEVVIRAVVKSTFVESKTSPSPKRFESESSPSPKRFESESSPSPKRFESKSKSKSK